MRSPMPIAAVLTSVFALGCDGASGPTIPIPDATVPPAPATDRAASPASQVDIAFAICPVGGDPGAARVTGEVIHIRESVADVVLLGDLEGAGYGLFDLDLLLDGFTGPARGNFRFELTELLGNSVDDGGFAGRHHGRQGPRFSGRATGRGFGELEGLKIRYAFEGRPPTNGFAVYGVLTDPTGALEVAGQPQGPPDCPGPGGGG